MFYVYTYIIDGVPRYVGKGVGVRWKKHRKLQTKLGAYLREQTDWLLPNIVECEDENAALAEEQRLIKLYGREDLGLGPLWNLTNGGDGVSGHRHKAEFKTRLAEERKGERNPFFGKEHSLESREAARQANVDHKRSVGKHYTEEHRKNIARGVSGIRNAACKVPPSEYPRVFALRASGLTQKQIGDLIGIGQSQVSKILKGK